MCEKCMSRNMLEINLFTLSCKYNRARTVKLEYSVATNENGLKTSRAYHPLFVLQTCASCILMAASVVYKEFCEYDN